MGGPADLFFVLFVANCWRGGILWAQLRKDREMKPKELYELLDDNAIDYEVIEIFEGARLLNIRVWEEENEKEELT